MKTSKDYTVEFKHYGLITVPAGTTLTHKTAIGIDPKYHFVNDLRWIDTNYPEIANILKDDATYSGINVPVEYVDYEVSESESVTPLAAVNRPLLGNYYRSQLDKLGNPKSGYPPQFKFNSNDTGNTNWMSLNDESAQVLVTWLNEHYNIQLI